MFRAQRAVRSGGNSDALDHVCKSQVSERVRCAKIVGLTPERGLGGLLLEMK